MNIFYNYYKGGLLLILIFSVDSSFGIINDISLIQSGDRAYRAFRFHAAIDLYQRALKENFSDTVVVKLSDATFFAAQVASKKEEKERNYLAAQHVLNQGLEKYPHSADILARLGRIIGKLALLKNSNKEKIRIGLQVATYSKKALAIDQNHVLANTVFGVYQYSLATLNAFVRMIGDLFFGSIPKGDLQKAKHHLKVAVKNAPEEIYSHYMLAKTLFELDELESAQESITKLIDLPNIYPNDFRTKNNAKKLLFKIYRKKRKRVRL